MTATPSDTSALAPVGGLKDDGARTRILVLAPTSNDARLTARFLQKSGLDAEICEDARDLCECIRNGCGAVIIAEEVLGGEALELLASTLSAQPSWSELPVILITGGARSEHRRHPLGSLAVGSASIIERPFRPGTLVRAVQVALRSRRRQYQVRNLMIELQEMDRRKDEFLAMLAHELRNPLASVTSAISVLKDGADLEGHAWAVNVIERQSGHLAHLIGDLLDVARITSGKIKLRKETTDAVILLRRACESMRPMILAHRHELVCECGEEALWIDADPIRIEQIIINLLSNAAKYTPQQGRISVAAKRVGGEIMISVVDNGMGISRQRLPEIFALFAQGERSFDRSEGGLGIGLTIVQRLAELHGGRIDAQSEGRDKGSTFTLRLPAVEALPGLPPLPGMASQTTSLRVLVVDDNRDSAEALAKLLSRAGHSVMLAHDGAEALVLAREHAPEAVVLDIGLPVMNGYEVARCLRQEAATSHALIIAVTGYGQEADKMEAFKAGFDHHLIKPISVKELKVLLSQRTQK